MKVKDKFEACLYRVNYKKELEKAHGSSFKPLVFTPMEPYMLRFESSYLDMKMVSMPKPKFFKSSHRQQFSRLFKVKSKFEASLVKEMFSHPKELTHVKEYLPR